VSKSFPGGAVALRDVSLEIASGELLVLLGSSGAGKSTTLRLLAGLESPDRGRIRIDGADVTAQPPHQRDLAMVCQDHTLLPHLSVRQNLELGARLRGLAAPRIAERVAEVANLLGLAGLLDRQPRQLSGGERQRVALGRALVRQPRAYLLDEPFAHLDPPLRFLMRHELRGLQRRLGVSMIHVTHDQDEALALADRIAILHAGVLQQVGTPRQVLERPANAFVAQFVGQPAMNLLPAADGTLLGIRPQDVRLGAGDRAGEVMAVHPFAGAWLVEVQCGEQVIRVQTGESPTPGDTVRLSLPADSAWRFDARTGRRLEL
jgi:multiple sugar transport system ATP-binding protein